MPKTMQIVDNVLSQNNWPEDKHEWLITMAIALLEAKEIISAVSNGENNRRGDAIDWRQKHV